ncbi:MAG: DoxX family protein [Acidimicrobiales bacterium]
MTNYADQMDNIMLLVRIFLGFTLAFHGYWKFFKGGKIAGTAGWFDSMGMKPNGKVHAYLAASTELGCGVLMAVGFLTPLAAAGYVSLMIVAAWTVHRANGYRSGIDGWEYNSVLAVFAAYVAATSPGRHSIDHAMELSFAFKPYTAFGIAIGVGVAGAVGLLAACYRPPAKAAE